MFYFQGLIKYYKLDNALYLLLVEAKVKKSAKQRDLIDIFLNTVDSFEQNKKMAIFFVTLKSLGVSKKRPVVEGKIFIQELVKTGKFTEKEVRKYIKKLQVWNTMYD
jgi:hypothetical protein